MDKLTGDGVKIVSQAQTAKLDPKKVFGQAVNRTPIRRIGMERGRAIYTQPVVYECAVRRVPAVDIFGNVIKDASGRPKFRERYASVFQRPSQAKIRRLRRRNNFHTR